MKPSHIGFKQYTSAKDSSTFAVAHQEFEKWFNETFLPNVNQYHNGDVKRHHRYSIYINLRTIINRHKENHTPIFISDFFNDVFGELFEMLDAEAEARLRRVQTMIKSDRDVRGSMWNEVKAILQNGEKDIEVKLSMIQNIFSDEWAEIEQAQKQLKTDQDRVTSEIFKFETELKEAETDLKSLFKPRPKKSA